MSENEELPVQHVAMVVFVQVPAVDHIDGAGCAEAALRQAIAHTELAPPRLPATIHAHLRKDDVPVTGVKELNTAVLNGYLRLQPSNRAYPRQEEEEQ